MPTSLRTFVLVALVGAAACGTRGDGEQKEAPASAAPRSAPMPPVQVAAASDLSAAFAALAGAFEQRTQQKVSITFGSTGLLAKQVREGAPFDVFAAANVSFVDDLVNAKACDGATRAPYARGRIVVWWDPKKVASPKTLADLSDVRFKRIAIANPEHAPYGKAAKQALEVSEVWRSVEPRIVYGENVKQTLQFAETGNTEAAIVALSLVLGEAEGAYLLIDDALHEPIDQALVVCGGGKNAQGGRAFAAFVNAPEGRAIMKRYGFVLPSETLTLPP